MNTWIAVLAVGAGSFVFRLAPLLLLERRRLSDAADRGIRHAGLAAITALIAVSAVHASSGGNATATVAAVGVALALAARGTSMLRTVLLGGAVYAAITLALHALTR